MPVAWAINPAPRRVWHRSSTTRRRSGSGVRFRAVAGPARAVLETRCTLGPVAVAPLARRLVVDLEPLRDGGHAPAFLDDESDHLEPMRRGERRVGVLGPSNL